MIYLEDISAFEFWTSLARARIDIGSLRQVSSLESCPTTAHESTQVRLGTVPFDFSQLCAAVPDPSFRVQRSRFKYHVWTGTVPTGAFTRVARDFCVASPALTLAQIGRRLSVPKLAQVICEMRGSYVRVRGRDGGMFDQLLPIVTAEEIERTAAALQGRYDCRRLLTALPFTADASASPKETELLLLLAMTKRRGGAAIGNWKMNVELPVPEGYRRYLDKGKLKPDLLNEEKHVIVEYDSSEVHDETQRSAEDRKRVRILRAMGYQVITVFWPDIADALAFEQIVREVKEALGLPYRKTSEQGIAARQRLIDELRTMPQIGYP